jgi:polysaccharide biosynthesis protein PslH
MRILWLKTDFLHPTNKGGLIRTLEMLKCLHARHEVHYVGMHSRHDPPEGLARAHEYAAKVLPVPFEPVNKRSLAFVPQLVGGVFSSLPMAVSRWASNNMYRQVEKLRRENSYDAVVCDFLACAPNTPALEEAILFQHNVEMMIWRRHAENRSGPAKAFFQLQASRMEAYERKVCQTVRHVIAVSPQDARQMEKEFALPHVSDVPTGVNLPYFQPPAGAAPASADLVFVGSMDWMPNIDGIRWFVREVLPLIRRRLPSCTVAVVGRAPDAEMQALAAQDPYLKVTGTVPDVRPWLHGAALSIVPLRIGGGTRLKIYEAMAAGAPVLSTTIGAEGLDITHGETIWLADTAETFAEAAVELLKDETRRRTIAQAAMERVAARYSWDSIAEQFAIILASHT